MQKHANTYFPGDKVSQVKPDGTKVAGHEQGTVTGGDPESNKIKVSWPDGHEEWCSPESLTKD